jgi:hypothetical protein
MASLAPASSAEIIYESVRKVWYQHCLKAKDDPAPAIRPRQFFGSTDGSFNVLSMESGNTQKTEKTAEEKAALHAKQEVKDAKKQAEDKLRAEEKLAAAIKPGDPDSKKAAEQAKEGDAAVDPSEPASPIEAAAAEAEADEENRKLLLQDSEKAQALLASVEEQSDSQIAQIDVATVKIKEAQIALERAERV